jgi:hypothetical protein
MQGHLTYGLRHVRSSALLSLFWCLVVCCQLHHSTCWAIEPATSTPKSEVATDANYSAFANTQVYASDRTDVWLFVDIDARTVRQGYSERPDVGTGGVFRAIRIEPNGTWHLWEDKENNINANHSVFVKKNAGFFAISVHCDVFEFSREGTCNVIKRSDASLLGLSLKIDDWEGNQRSVDSLNRENDFKLLADTSYMKHLIDKDIFGKEGLKIALEFQPHVQPLRKGYGKAVARSLGDRKWEVTLIDLLSPPSESKH